MSNHNTRQITVCYLFFLYILVIYTIFIMLFGTLMKVTRNVIYIVLALCLFTHLPATADEALNIKNNELEQRIIALEKLVESLILENKKPIFPINNSTSSTQLSNNKQQQLNQKKIAEHSVQLKKVNDISEQAEMAIYSYEDLSEEISNNINIAGYADVEYRGYNDPNKNEEFRIHHLSLFFTKQFDNNIKFFSEIEYEDAPKFEGASDGSGNSKVSSGKIFVEALNFDWNYSQHFNMRLGRFFTPAGIWSEDHYPPFVTTQERPLHIRKIFPQLVDGILVFGSTEIVQNHFFNYTTFLGNGESEANSSGKTDLNSSKGVGFKGDYSAPWLDDFILGFTLYQDNNDSSVNVNETINAKKFAYGYHVKLRQNDFTFQGEYSKGTLDFEKSLENYKTEGYYAQLVYKLDQWGLGYRYDVFNEKDITIEEITRNSLFVNYHVNEHFTIKGEYHHDSNKALLKNDYGFYVLSITGYLGK